MSIESTLFTLLGPLAANRVYPDLTPENPTFPLIVYQQVGGTAGWYVENAMPDKKNARIQINVWAKTRVEANTLARLIELTICQSTLIAEPYGALTALYDDTLKIFGTRQDYGIFYPD
jgi:hypothetical protein